jgi:CubicO group peptidase (beta-lactamase class C family)
VLFVPLTIVIAAGARPAPDEKPALALRNDDALGALGVARPNAPYISSPVGRHLTTTTTTWNPAIVEQLRALAVETRSRGLLLLHGDDVVIDAAPQGRGPFEVASISKGITALAVARLVDEGRIGFDDLLATMIPEWRKDDRKKVRVRDLLSHTSGLSPSLSMALEPPGGAPSYHLAAYDVLPAIITERSGVPFTRYVNEHLLRPAGGTGIVVWDNNEEGIAYASHGAHVTLDDLAVLGKLMLNGGFTKDGEVLRARTLDEVTRAHGRYARGFGLGWFMHHATDNALQFDIVESRGASGHMVTVLPNKQAVLVRIGSLGNDAGIPERFHALLRQL